MNMNKVKKEIEALKQSKSDKNQRPPFSTLERINEGELTPEEGLELLKDGNEAFADEQTVLIKSGLKHGRFPK